MRFRRVRFSGRCTCGLSKTSAEADPTKRSQVERVDVAQVFNPCARCGRKDVVGLTNCVVRTGLKTRATNNDHYGSTARRPASPERRQWARHATLPRAADAACGRL